MFRKGPFGRQKTPRRDTPEQIGRPCHHQGLAGDEADYLHSAVHTALSLLAEASQRLFLDAQIRRVVGKGMRRIPPAADFPDDFFADCSGRGFDVDRDLRVNPFGAESTTAALAFMAAAIHKQGKEQVFHPNLVA
jgi:hypothetical protein